MEMREQGGFLTTCFMGQHSFQAGALCPSLASGWFSACPGKEKVKFQRGRKEHFLVDHKQFFSVNTDFSLAPAQKCCLNQTQKEAELSLLVVLFKLFPKDCVPSQGLCCLKCSFLFRKVRSVADKTVAGVLPGHTFVHLLVVWMCVGWGSRLPNFPHRSEKPALCCRAVS